MPATPIEINLEIEFQDFRRAWELARKRRLKLVYPFGILAVAYGILVMVGDFGLGPFGGLLISTGIVALLTPMTLTAIRRRAWPNYRRLLGSGVLRLDDSGVQLETRLTQVFYAWEAFMFFREDRDLFVLYVTNRAGIIVPKRTLTPSAMTMEFPALLRSKLPQRGPQPASKI